MQDFQRLKKSLLQKSSAIFHQLSKNIDVLLVLLLAMLLANILIYDALVSRQTTASRLLPIVVTMPTNNDYPLFSVASSNRKQEILSALSAESAIIMDDNTKVILASKNPQLRFSMASTTKIMTALVGFEYFKPKDILTVMPNNAYGTMVGLKTGQQFYFIDLLYAMLLPSGNDVAYTIAQNYPGGMEAFIARMNSKAKELHLANIHYSDPAGLDDNGDYATVLDLARLASIAMQNSTFVQVVGTKNTVVTTIDKKDAYTVSNLNKLLGINGVSGIKTGFTDEAGGVLVTAQDVAGHRVIIVVMKSADRFADTRLLLSLTTGNITYRIFH